MFFLCVGDEKMADRENMLLQYNSIYDTLPDNTVWEAKKILKAVVCDDDKVFLDFFSKQIQREAKALGLEVEVIPFLSAIDLKKEIDRLLRQTNVVYFLDIDMPKVTGFDVAGYLREQKKDSYIVFVSQKDELVFQSLGYHPFFFLRKKNIAPELKTQMAELRDLLFPDHHMVVAKRDYEEIKVPIESIYMVEGDRNYIIIYRDGDQAGQGLRIRMTLANAYDSWKKFGFLWVHKGFLINSHYVSKLTRNQIVLTNGTVVQVGRSHLEAVRQALFEDNANG